LECEANDNLVVKAFRLLQEKYHLPNVKIHLHKHIPFGAGLGGGSADAAFTLKMLDAMFELNISEEQLIAYAASLGADCAFFIKNTPQIASGIGEVLIDAGINLKGKYLLLVKPDIAVPTANAYRYIVPSEPEVSLTKNILLPIKEWKWLVKNDFEVSVFKQYSVLSDLKNQMYDLGAVYAAMSGSGSSIFGIFDKKPQYNAIFATHFCFETAL
jgi:4-diphosphocytidyl-2-C-methyl-D-erythritol kinase